MEEMKSFKLESRGPIRPSNDVPGGPNSKPAQVRQVPDVDRCSGTPGPQGPDRVCSGHLEQLAKQLEQLSNSIEGCREQLSHVAREVDELRAADHIIADLSNRYRDLSERFHEREVLLPVIYCLIRIADGCQQQIDKWQKMRAKRVDFQDESAAKVLGLMIGTRRADLVELENALAHFGVECFRRHEDTFDPSAQKSIDSIECEDAALKGRIAERLVPGYRRDGKVVRKEYVNVYVLKNKKNDTGNGGN